MNNILHDRLFNTNMSSTNANWLSTLENNLLSNKESGSVFYFATQTNKATANIERRSIGTDIWILFLMSGIVPDRVTDWFSKTILPMFKSAKTKPQRNPLPMNTQRLGLLLGPRIGTDQTRRSATTVSCAKGPEGF